MKINMDLVISGVISIVLANVGILDLLNKDFPRGILILTLAFIVFYFTVYVSQIKENKKSIEKIDSDISNLQDGLETQGKLLNTIKDIIILKKKGVFK